jgi:hypothetical protein
MKEGLTFALAFPAPLDIYTSMYDMKYLASMVTYVVLLVENTKLELATTITDHYSPIVGGSTSVEACVQTTIKSGVPSSQIVLSAPSLSLLFTIYGVGESTNGLGDDTNGEGGFRFSYKNVG